MVQLDVWFDLVCPWSRMALSELNEAILELNQPLVLNIHAHRIDPDALPAYAESTIEHLMHKLEISREQAYEMLSNVVNRGQEFGLKFNFEIARGGNTMDGHRLVKLATERGVGLEVALELFKSHFALGNVPSDPMALTEIAAKFDIPVASVSEVLEGTKYQADVLSDEQQASELGIESRPFFIFNQTDRVEGILTKVQFLERLSLA